MKNNMINIKKVEVSNTSNGCVIFRVTADKVKFDMHINKRDLGRYYKNHDDGASIDAWLFINGNDYQVNFYPHIGCRYPKIENIDNNITYFVSIGSLEICSAVEQECKRACGYKLPEDRKVFVDRFSEDTDEISEEEEAEASEQGLSIECILDSLANDPMAISMLAKYASAGLKEKERMTSYLKAVILDK